LANGPGISETTKGDLVNLELTGKTALVTGGSLGIGRAIAFGLAAEGARVAICARDKSRLEQTAQEVKAKTNAEALIVPGDLSRLDEVNRVAATVKERLGRIDILINNAGAIRGGDFLKIPDEQWAGDWSLKILGYVRMARAVFPMMQAQGGGRIVNVVGAAARNPTPGYLTGGIANSGLINFSKGLADLGAPSNILVTAVSPAATATARWESLIAQQAALAGTTVEAQRAEAASQYPLKRIATPEDISDLVCFLVSARAAFITGVCITVDGGATRGVYL
jgi:NAD(P)-dependent dehydrogenase (short-subunit alcohol dehydrogenase family)